MRDLTILAVSDDAGWLSFFWSVARGFTGARLVIARSLEEAGELIDCATPDLIAVDWPSDRRRWEQMDQLLWSNSILPRPGTVLVTDEVYREETALRLFQAGVDEYVSLEDHPHSLPGVLGQWLGRTPEPVYSLINVELESGPDSRDEHMGMVMATDEVAVAAPA